MKLMNVFLKWYNQMQKWWLPLKNGFKVKIASWQKQFIIYCMMAIGAAADQKGDRRMTWARSSLIGEWMPAIAKSGERRKKEESEVKEGRKEVVRLALDILQATKKDGRGLRLHNSSQATTTQTTQLNKLHRNVLLHRKPMVDSNVTPIEHTVRFSKNNVGNSYQFLSLFEL